MGKRKTIDNITYSLVKTKQIIRLAWGVFIKKGSKLPSRRLILQFKNSLFGRKTATHGSTVARNLGLPVASRGRDATGKKKRAPIPQKQFDGQPFCVSGGSTSFKIFKHDDGECKQLIGTCERKLYLGEQQEGHAVRALWQMKKARFESLEDERILASLPVPASVLVENAAWMPAWISDRLHALSE
ncbi:MAG: hypothetical protein KGS72_05920 [Cyanobacteria bacterium REEB67]|nr:hypothetical protein [Cyanobacteria bacterium REEB67]